MRNLKRALSLTLASIMLLGMMVVGSSAASYQDVTDEHNVEAIEVLQAVGIMVGDEGNFNPDKNVTRNEMAVIMSNLMDYRVATYAGTSPFTDVPSWAEPYVAACYTNGITSGTSATTYNGSGNVTTAQAALMIMKALGYFQNTSDFKDDWMLATTRQANNIDLLVGVKAGVREAMTRNDVAQLVLNGLEAGTVEADNSNNINVSVGGAEVSVGDTKYVYVTSGQDYAYSISKNLTTGNDGQYSTGAIVELGEKLYQGALTKESAEGSYDRNGEFQNDGYEDVFGRPADHWEYEGKEIGTYAQAADTTFTTGVTSKALYNAVGSAAASSKYTWTVKVDGDNAVLLDEDGEPDVDGNGDYTYYTGTILNTNKTDDNDCFLDEAGFGEETGNGVLTQVYVDGTNRTVHVAVIHYYPAEVLRVNNASDKDRSITLSDLDWVNVDTNDVFETEEFEEDDIVVYSFADNAIREVFATDKLEGKVTQARAKTGDNGGDFFTVDETKYRYNWTVTNDEQHRLTTDNVDNNVVAYLDQFGYVTYIDESAATYDYAYVLSVGTKADDYDNVSSTRAAGGTVYARLVLTDGTVVKVETDNKYSEAAGLLNQLVSYSVNSKGIYTLKVQGESRADDGSLKIETGVAGITVNGGHYTANSNTIFIVADSDSGGDKDEYNFRVYTGIKNMPDVGKDPNKHTLSVVATGSGTNSTVAKVVYIEDADVSGLKDVIFIKANSEAKKDKTSGANKNFVLSAVVDGEVVELLVKEDSDAAKKLVTEIKDGMEYNPGYASIENKGKAWIVAAEYLTEDANGIVTNVKLYSDPMNEDGDGYLYEQGTMKAENGTVGLNTTRYGYSDDTAVARYDVDSGKFYVVKMNQIKNDSDDMVLGILDGRALTGICYLNTKSGAGVQPDGGDTPAPGDDTYEVTVKLDANSVVMNGDKAVKDGDKINVKKGETLTLTITAKDGYTVEVTGATKGEGNTYTVSAAGTVTVKTRAEGVGKLTTKNGFEITYKLINVGDTTYMDASIEYPAWVGNTAGTTVSGDIGVCIGSAVLNGSGSGDTLTFTRTAGTETTGSNTLDLGMIVDPATMDIKEITGSEFVASNVKVQLVGTDTDKLVSDYTKEVACDGTGTQITVTLATNTAKATIDANVKYTVKNGSDPVSTEAAASVNDTTKVFNVGASATDAKSDGYVVVTLTGLDKLTQSYKVTPLSATKLNGGDNTDDLTITGGTGLADAVTIALAGSPASGASGTSVIKATLASGVGSGNAALDVKIKLASGEEFEGTFESATTISVGEVTLDKNYDLSKGTITITQQKALAIDTTAEGTTDGVKIEGTTYTIYFNHNIKLKDGVDATTLVDNDDSKTVESVKADGNKLIVVLNAALGASKKIQVTAVADGITCAEHGDALAEDFVLVDTTP